MSGKEKKDKTVWVPKEWQDWTEKYFEQNEMELKKLGIKSANDLIWRLAELGKTDLDGLIEFARTQGMTKRRHEKPEEVRTVHNQTKENRQKQ